MTTTTNFAVFANGTFCGIAAAETAEDAMYMIAADVGTENSTEGMTAQIATECTWSELKDVQPAYFTEETTEGFSGADLDMMNVAAVILHSVTGADAQNICDALNNAWYDGIGIEALLSAARL